MSATGYEFKLGRRDVLRGLGTGAALLFPLLNSVVANAAGTTPMFLVIVPIQHGFGSRESSSGLNANFEYVAELAALSKFKSKSLLVDGVCGHFGAPQLNAHDASYTDMLTAAGVFGRGGSGQMLDPAGPSIDGYIEAKLPGTRTLRFSGNYTSFGLPYHPLSWSTDKKKLPYLTDYKSFINALQARIKPDDVNPPVTPPADALTVDERRKIVLDSVRDDLKTLRGRLPKSLQKPLDQKVEAIAQAHQQLALDEPTPGGGAGPMPSQIKCTALDTAVANAPNINGNDYTNAIGNVLSAVKTGVICGTHSIFITGFGDHYGAYRAVKADGSTYDKALTGDYHHLAAHGEGGTEHQDKHRGRVALHAQAIAKLASDLDAVVLPTGKTMLDHTLIVLTGEVGNGAHDVIRKPGIIIGGGAAFNTGRTIKNMSFRKAKSLRSDVPDWANADVPEYTEGSIWRLVGRAMGVSDMSGFGDPTRFQGTDIP